MIPVRQIEKTASDENLLQQYQSTGDQQLLAILYLRYIDLVYGTCMKYLKNEEDSKDAVMNIYQSLIQKLQTHNVDHFRSWLYVVTKNHCLMQLRREKKNIAVEFQPVHMQLEDFSHLDAVLEKEKELQRLEKCIETLQEEQQRAITLFYLENKCYNEIADATGMEWNRVRSLIQNGRRNLKNCMEENGR
ncbi:MAG: sigma-70 family RNA polymerase sigma factor [Bacteroidota bacterium]|nr:sigma-70 family RNA polymerase sigma factor [Bacteroidota bacterium]